MAEWIAVVDDDAANLHLAKYILGKHDITVSMLNSGEELLSSIDNGGQPDLILLDILMPDMDGFETLRRLREMEAERGVSEVPVVFLTADEDKETETRGLAAGALDFIRKPFEGDALVQRVRNIIAQTRRVQELAKSSETDQLTGLLNKAGATEHLHKVCAEDNGVFMMIDLDGFKLVNDLYGHDMGDKVLAAFADILRSNVHEDDVTGRIGGDEFALFYRGVHDREVVRDVTDRLNERLMSHAKMLMGPDMKIPLGVSVGAVFVPDSGTDYDDIFRYADRALYYVKNNGKHACAVYDDLRDDGESGVGDMNSLSMALAERNASSRAMWIGEDAFREVYQFMMRYIQSYRGVAYKALLTLKPLPGAEPDEKAGMEIYHEFGELVQNTLRKSDIMMQSGKNQYFLLLPELEEKYAESVMNRILKMWHEREFADRMQIHYELQIVEPLKAEAIRRSHDNMDRPPEAGGPVRVVVVDDDRMNLQTAGTILSKNHMHVTALMSGDLLLKHISDGNRPDLILLDIMMAGMDGFESIDRLRKLESDLHMDPTPVIFLTANDDQETETKGLRLGAMDFIRKPFVPDVLVARVRHTIELTALQKNLASEVHRKTIENEELSLQVVLAIADAIDAKDTYTNGHSRRVAEYARAIARRYGYDKKKQKDIYMMGLLHDVGKIGVPDAVINKPAKLTDEEFEMIKNHPVMGARILKNIEAMPQLVTGARWHHERYGGGGYPDGISGDDIPEEARIIAVADAYDAMSSRRSYREALPQDVVRSEIVKGRGTQFDPVFADIMMKMIDADTTYALREQ